MELTFKQLDPKKTIIFQCTSEYPCPSENLNLRTINTLKEKFKVPIGLSSHHTSPIMAAMAIAYGACSVEVHITLDRAMWGTDQSMSLEPRGMEILTKAVKEFEKALGTNTKDVTEKEKLTLSRTVGREI